MTTPTNLNLPSVKKNAKTFTFICEQKRFFKVLFLFKKQSNSIKVYLQQTEFRKITKVIFYRFLYASFFATFVCF